MAEKCNILCVIPKQTSIFCFFIFELLTTISSTVWRWHTSFKIDPRPLSTAYELISLLMQTRNAAFNQTNAQRGSSPGDTRSHRQPGFTELSGQLRHTVIDGRHPRCGASDPLLDCYENEFTTQLQSFRCQNTYFSLDEAAYNGMKHKGFRGTHEP